MEVYLIRHPKPLVEKGICYGQTDLDLAPGWQDAVAGVQALVPPLERIYTSPLKRCLLAAAHLAQKEPLVDPDLAELNFGQWEGKPWSQLPEEEVRPWSEDLLHKAPPGGESGMDLARRRRRFVDRLKAADEDTVIFTHTGWIRTLLADLLQSPLDLAFHLQIDFCGVTHVTFKDAWVRVNYVNRI